MADVSYWGPEAEFFVFDDVRYGGSTHAAYAGAGKKSAMGMGQTSKPEPRLAGAKSATNTYTASPLTSIRSYNSR